MNEVHRLHVQSFGQTDGDICLPGDSGLLWGTAKDG